MTSTRYNKKGPVDSVGLSMESGLGPGSRVGLSVESGLETPGVKLRAPVSCNSKSDSNQKLYFCWLLVPHQDLPSGMSDRLIQTNTQVCKCMSLVSLHFAF